MTKITAAQLYAAAKNLKKQANNHGPTLAFTLGFAGFDFDEGPDPEGGGRDIGWECLTELAKLINDEIAPRKK